MKLVVPSYLLYSYLQIKRAKQRLVAGYFMQSLILRHYLFSSVQYAMMCGWMGMLIPGGAVR